jgi:hypothetical protein
VLNVRMLERVGLGDSLTTTEIFFKHTRASL